MPEYRATFKINGGESNGFGLKSPIEETRTEIILAPDEPQAYVCAIRLAEDFSNNYLSDPNTGLTRVELLALTSGADLVDLGQKERVVSRSWIEHILTNPLEELPNT